MAGKDEREDEIFNRKCGKHDAKYKDNSSLCALNTEDYQEWIGGHGIATAIFYDLVKDKTVSAFDPRNVLVIVPGLFAGTLVPAAGRMEMVGIQAQSFPYEWFSRSNVGGRFGTVLKYSGYDGIVLEGASEEPTWLNINEKNVELINARNLWGCRLDWGLL